MHYGIALAALPTLVLVWAAWPASEPAPIAAKAVLTEGIREQRQDASTFRLRWSVVSELPPATVVTEVPVETIRARPPPAAPARKVRRASLRMDLCQRHHMRKVYYGRTWRCRQ